VPEVRPADRDASAHLQGLEGTLMAKKKGRPAVIAERFHYTNVALSDRQLVRLDRVATDVLVRSGRRVSRAAILRNLIDAADNSELFEAAYGGAK
jgi:hypothetical protein